MESERKHEWNLVQNLRPNVSLTLWPHEYELDVLLLHGLADVDEGHAHLEVNERHAGHVQEEILGLENESIVLQHQYLGIHKFHYPG